VRAAQSLGPQRTEIPNVVGQSARAAEINVRRRGLELGSTAVGVIPGAAADQIIAQTPPANAGTVESPKISVLLAAPEADRQFVMPNFVGKHLADVSQQLEDAGFLLGHISDVAPSLTTGNLNSNSSNMGPSVITKQNPAPGQKIAAGATVSFEVSH
jgi:beta-lactam-binding protein with PASTA domain